MTRDKIIEGLKSILAQDIYWEDDVAVMQEAITALQAQDIDAVSRQAVMWMLTNLSYTQCRTQGEVEVIGLAKTMLIAMPSAQEVNNSNQEVNNSTSTQPNGIESQASYRQVTGKLDVTDCISRQDAIDAVSKYNFDFPQYMERFVTELRDAMKADLKHDIDALPSAQPERTRFADKDHVWIDGKQYISLQMFQKAVKESQPDIIRCRDCSKCQYDTLFDKYWCKGREVREDFYCGDAVRKEN